MSFERAPNETQELREFRREIKLAPLEMLGIAEIAKQCVNEALTKDTFVVGDNSSFIDIPHHNGLRTGAMRLLTRDATFSGMNITFPRKDIDLSIRIEATDSTLPDRRITFIETKGHLPGKYKDGFFINDSHALVMAAQGRALDPMATKEEVANWLYHQVRMPSHDIKNKMRSESDPVRNACDLLSINAKQRFDSRQVRVAFSPDSEMVGELIEEIDTSNPLSEPLVRQYRLWLLNHHEVDGSVVTERLLVNFSPDDVLLGLHSNYQNTEVSIETIHPTLDIEALATTQALAYENGEVAAAFNRAYRKLEAVLKAA